jgi:hypothetical protein
MITLSCVKERWHVVERPTSISTPAALGGVLSTNSVES